MWETEGKHTCTLNVVFSCHWWESHVTGRVTKTFRKRVLNAGLKDSLVLSPVVLLVHRHPAALLWGYLPPARVQIPTAIMLMIYIYNDVEYHSETRLCKKVPTNGSYVKAKSLYRLESAPSFWSLCQRFVSVIFLTNSFVVCTLRTLYGLETLKHTFYSFPNHVFIQEFSAPWLQRPLRGGSLEFIHETPPFPLRRSDLTRGAWNASEETERDVFREERRGLGPPPRWPLGLQLRERRRSGSNPTLVSRQSARD